MLVALTNKSLLLNIKLKKNEIFSYRYVDVVLVVFKKCIFFSKTFQKFMFVEKFSIIILFTSKFYYSFEIFRICFYISEFS